MVNSKERGAAPILLRAPAHGIWEESESRDHTLPDYSGERASLLMFPVVLILVLFCLTHLDQTVRR